MRRRIPLRLATQYMFTVILLATLLAGAILLVINQSDHAETEQVADALASAHSAELADRTSLAFASLDADLNLYVTLSPLLRREAQTERAVVVDISRLTERMYALRTVVGLRTPSWRNLESSVQRYLADATQVQKYIHKGQTTQAQQLQDVGNNAVTLNVQNQLRALRLAFDKKALASAETFRTIKKQTLEETYIGLTLSLFLIMVLGYLLTRALGRRLTYLAGQAQRLAHGEIRDLALRRSWVVDEVDELTDTIRGAVLDIEIAHEKEQQALASARAQEELAELRTEFLANMSHELRTPLNSIIGFSDLMLERRDLNERDMRYAHNVLDSGKHLLQLVNDLLDMAKIDAGHFDLQLEDCDVGHEVERAVNSVMPQMKSRQLKCSFECSEKVFSLADAFRLRQAVLNLLSNAYKFTEPGGKVDVRVRRKESEVQISVSDTGSGIPSEQLQNIFDEFVQVSQGVSRTAEGTGLGLALTRRLLRLMDGDVTVQSVQDEGSIFTIHLPALESLEWADDGTKRILIIEDDTTSRDLVTEALAGLNFDIRWASSLAMARTLCLRSRPDLVILDILLPDGNGHELVDNLLPGAISVPFIVTSVVEKPDFVGISVVHWFTKPVDMAKMREVVLTVLDN